MMHTAMFLTMGPTFHGSSSSSSHLHHSNTGPAALEITPQPLPPPPPQNAPVIVASSSSSSTPVIGRFQPSPHPTTATRADDGDDEVFITARGAVSHSANSSLQPMNVVDGCDHQLLTVNKNNNIEVDRLFFPPEKEDAETKERDDEASIKNLSRLNRYNLQQLQQQQRRNHHHYSGDSPPDSPPMSEVASKAPSSIDSSTADARSPPRSRPHFSMTTSDVQRPPFVPPPHATDNCFFHCLQNGGGGDRDVDRVVAANVGSSPQPQAQHRQPCPHQFLLYDRLLDFWDAFSKHAEDGVLHERRVRSALLELDVYPAQAQIQEMLYVTGKRSPTSKLQQQQRLHDGATTTTTTTTTSSFSSSCNSVRTYLTFGEFCFFASDLKEKYERRPLPPTLWAKQRRNVERGRKFRKFSSLVSNFQVFLGGACNPTSWRQDIAIPILSQHSISFYNPQQPDWNPQMIEIEDQAKQVADVLLFVVDNKTRSTSSMVEAAYLTGCDCSVFLVVKSYEGPGAEVQGERMSQSEYADLNKAQLYLTDIVERHGLPVFSDIKTAIHCAIKTLGTKDMRVQDLTLEDGAQPVRFGHIKLGDRFIGAGQVFQSYDPQRTGCIGAKDVCVAFKSITKEDLDDATLAKFKQPSPVCACSPLTTNYHHHHYHHHHHAGGTKRRTAPFFNFDEFCCALTNFKNNSHKCNRSIFNNDVDQNDVVPGDARHDAISGGGGGSKSAPSTPSPSPSSRGGVGVAGEKTRWWRLRRFLLCKFATWFLPSATAPAPSRGVGGGGGGGGGGNNTASSSASTTPNQRGNQRSSGCNTCNIPPSSSVTLSSSPSSVSLSPSFSPSSAIGSLPSSGCPITTQPSPTPVGLESNADATTSSPHSHNRQHDGVMTHSASQTLVNNPPGSLTSSASSSGISSAHSPSFSSSLSSASNGLPTSSSCSSAFSAPPHFHHQTNNINPPPPPPPPSTPSAAAPRFASSSSSRRYDIFLGGSIRDSHWRENIAIPQLKKKGISYYHPKKSLGIDGYSSNSPSNGDEIEDPRSSSSATTESTPETTETATSYDPAVVSGRFLPMEATYRENSSLLLYVIDATSRGLASMLEAAYYIGQGCRMVLCIREIPGGAVILQDKLSNNAIRDYNRSRRYLADIANQEHVPIFESIHDSVSEAIAILETQRNANGNSTP